MYVIGTAGHVDHGKSTLIKNLTSIDPDRLVEEKKREMTLDLGFAWFNSKNKYPIGVVDVPGHEDLVDNMLKGVYAIDLGLLVVSSVESVKQQTVEHLEILKMSNIQKIILVLTKKDLVPEDILNKHLLESRKLLTDHNINDFQHICVNSNNSNDIDNLKNLIYSELNTIVRPNISNSSRMYVDRVFHKKGYGTIATGTLLNGIFKINDEIYIDGKLKSKIRTMQSYDTDIDEAVSRSRLAINLNSINLDEIKKGSVLTDNNYKILQNSVILKIQLSSSYKKPLKHNSEVQIFIGSSQAKCRLIFNDVNELKSGESIFALAKLDNNIHFQTYDTVILRSSGETIAGGVVLSPGESIKVFKSDKFLKYLNFIFNKDIKNSLLNLLSVKKILDFKEIRYYLNLDIYSSEKNINDLNTNKLVIALKTSAGNYSLIDKKWHQNKLKKLLIILKNYHELFPLRKGINKNEVAQKLYPNLEYKISGLLIDNFLKTKYIDRVDDIVFLSEFVNTEESIPSEIKNIINKLTLSSEIIVDHSAIDNEVLSYLINHSHLIKLSKTIFVTKIWFGISKEIILKHFEHNDKLDIQNTKTLLNVSRKLTVAFLEKLDLDNITRRVENYRILIK